MADLFNSICGLCAVIVTAWNYHDGDYQRATFDAVLVLWCLLWQRRSDNGDGKHV